MTLIFRHVIMTSMDQKPLQEFPSQAGSPAPKKNLIRQLMAGWTRLGLNETVVRFSTNFLSLLVIFAVIWLMQFLFHDLVNPQAAPVDQSSAAPVMESALLPEAISASLDGIARRASLHTSIPTRPRMDVIQYTVQAGDSIFGIAENYNLKPTSILFANSILGDNPTIEVVIPKSAVLGGSYIQAISAYAPHPNAAKLWMEYLYSDEGQLGWLKGYCHPIRFEDMKSRNVIPADLAAKLPEFNGPVAFPSIDQINNSKAVIAEKWMTVVGADVKE